MNIPTSKFLDLSPFVVFPTSHGSSSGPGSSSDQVLDLLGQCDGGNIYINRKFASVGLVCGGLAKDVENTVKSLVASHLRDENAQVLVIYADGSTIRPVPCPLVALSEESVVLVSPRNLESSSALYTSLGATTFPLRFEEGSVATRHILSLFTPSVEVDGRDAIINTVRLILSQIGEPFNLQHFIQLVDKESWTGAGENFIALRQTILITLLSSQSSTSFPSARQVIVDLRDHIPRSTGIEAALMDMALHQMLLQPSTRRRLVVFYNAFDYVPSDSLLSQSLEALAASGGERPSSIILATASPSRIPLHVFNSLDYLVCGFGLSSMWHGVLRDHFSIDLPRLGRQSGRQVIWSPQSKIYPDFEPETDHQPQYWDDNLMMIPIPSEYQDISPKVFNNLDSSATKSNSVVSTQPANQAPSLSSFEPEEEEGMVPLRPTATATGIGMFDDTIHESGGTEFVGSEIYQRQRVTVSIPEQEQQPTLHCSTYPDLFHPLIAGVLALRNSEDDGWVGFEGLRKIVGDAATIKALGWGTYTSFVKKAVEQRVLELRMVGKKMESVRLLPRKMWEDHISPLTPSSLILGICPTGHGAPRPIVEAILQLTGGDIGVKVTLEDLTNAFAETPEEMETLKIKGLTFGHLVKLACEGGWTQKGNFEGRRCIWLGPKLHPLAETLRAVQNLGPRSDHSNPTSEAETDDVSPNLPQSRR